MARLKSRSRSKNISGKSNTAAAKKVSRRTTVSARKKSTHPGAYKKHIKKSAAGTVKASRIKKSSNATKNVDAVLSRVGGQAVINGVMMRGPNHYAVAVRRLSGRIATKVFPFQPYAQRNAFWKIPFFRGIAAFIESMVIGTKSLFYSADIATQDLEKEEALKAKKERAHHTDTGKKKKAASGLSDEAVFASILFSLVLMIGVFIVLPNLFVENVIHISQANKPFLFNLVYGAARIAVLTLYMWGIAFLEKEIKTVYQYHGAEHKTIYTFENGKALTVANAKPYTTLHPRCGTAFLFLIMFISVLFFSLVDYFWSQAIPGFREWKFAYATHSLNLFALAGNTIALHWNTGVFLQKLINISSHILLLAPVSALSYELIRVGAQYPKNIILRALIYPGLLLQRITTQEPDDQQLMVGIASLKALITVSKKKRTANNKK